MISEEQTAGRHKVDTHQIDTLLATAGCVPDPQTGAIIPPIHLATTYERDKDGEYPRGFAYSRDANPTRKLLETTLSTLERGTSSFAFASGMAAAHALLGSLPPGTHVLIPDDVYYGVRILLEEQWVHAAGSYSECDMTNIEAVRESVRPETSLVWLETPSNPGCKVTDIQAVVRLARDSGALVVVDSTWTTPVVQQPLLLGADIVLHSLTKYLAGHSDVLGGALVFRTAGEIEERVRKFQHLSGGVMDPFSSWLCLRGIRSLGARMRLHLENADRIAHFLAAHPAVSATHYPGLRSHPQHEVAARQMRGFGGMISFQVGSRDAAFRVVGAARLFRRATSLGGTESLIEHRQSIEGPSSRTPPDLIRLSVGLEHPDDLIADLKQALEW